MFDHSHCQNIHSQRQIAVFCPFLAKKEVPQSAQKDDKVNVKKRQITVFCPFLAKKEVPQSAQKGDKEGLNPIWAMPK